MGYCHFQELLKELIIPQDNGLGPFPESVCAAVLSHRRNNRQYLHNEILSLPYPSESSAGIYRHRCPASLSVDNGNNVDTGGTGRFGWDMLDFYRIDLDILSLPGGIFD